MNNIARIYRAELLRAILGGRANETRVADIDRLNRFAEHLASCEEAQAALRAKGYGSAGMSFVEVVREVPTNELGRLKSLFMPRPSPAQYPELGEVSDAWSVR